MKITRRQLRRLIKESCGDVDAAADPLSIELAPASTMVESATTEQDLMVEMEVAQRALSQVVESVQIAAQLCQDCVPAIAAQAPLMEAMAAQAEALQENLDAQAQVVAESAGEEFPVLDAIADAADMVADVVDPMAERNTVSLGFSGPGFH
jgi:hypothetical protein